MSTNTEEMDKLLLESHRKEILDKIDSFVNFGDGIITQETLKTTREIVNSVDCDDVFPGWSGEIVLDFGDIEVIVKGERCDMFWEKDGRNIMSEWDLTKDQVVTNLSQLASRDFEETAESKKNE